MSRFAALIVAIIAGILCFLGIMYYFKWRRETGGNFSFSNMFGTHQNPLNPPHVNAPGSAPYAAPHYGDQYGTGYPHQGNTYPNQGAPGYYNNPNHPNYPPI